VADPKSCCIYQGSQYTSEQFQRLLAEQGITCSMSRQGDVWGNAAMELLAGVLAALIDAAALWVCHGARSP